MTQSQTSPVRAATGRREPSRRPRGALRRQEDLQGKLLVAPTVLVVSAAFFLPLLAVIVFAFTRVRLIDIPRLTFDRLRWTTDNFATMWASPTFLPALRTTVVYAVGTTLTSLAIGTAIALVLRRPFFGRGLVRALVLIPYVLPVVAATTIWKVMLNPQYGIVNAFGTKVLGWESPLAFLTTTSVSVGGVDVPVALPTVILFEAWKTAPLVFLFVTARLQVIPDELEEAAQIDGAGPVRILRHIVLPQLTGVLALLLLLRFIWSFQSFNDVYLLTEGAGGTEVLAVRVYSELITRANIGTASATGLMMTAVLLVFLGAYFLLLRKRGEVG